MSVYKKDFLLLSLDPRFRAIATDIYTKVQLRTGAPWIIVDTLRTPEQQAKNVLSGVSWTIKSRHLPQPPSGLALAIDLAPPEYLHIKGWNPTGPMWWELGELIITYALPQFSCPARLVSGMDWGGIGLSTVGTTRSQWDPGHFELILSDPLGTLITQEIT